MDKKVWYFTLEYSSPKYYVKKNDILIYSIRIPFELCLNAILYSPNIVILYLHIISLFLFPSL